MLAVLGIKNVQKKQENEKLYYGFFNDE